MKPVVVIIAPEDMRASTWTDAWPDARMLSPEQTGTLSAPPALLVVVAGCRGWLEHIQTCSHQGSAVLVLSRTGSLQELQQALQAGARGYLSLLSDAETLQTAAATIRQGALWLPPAMLDNLVQFVAQVLPSREAEEDPFRTLTAREQAVAQAVSRGLSNKAVARELDISERTVKLHLTSVFSKLGIRDRMQLLLLSRRPSKEAPPACS